MKTLVRDTRANILINSCQRLVSNRPAKSKRERKSMEFLVEEQYMINTTQKVNLKMENRLELGLAGASVDWQENRRSLDGKSGTKNDSIACF